MKPIVFFMLLTSCFVSAHTWSADTGNLKLITDPAGASVFINGHIAGATPLSYENVPKGAYVIRFEKDGCQPVSRRIVVGGGEAIASEKLPPCATGSINVDVNPKGAEVLLDGELAGHTPLKLDKVPIGPYELTIQKPNFESYVRSIAVTPDCKLIFSGDDLLTDKILGTLNDLVRTEPQRVAHYIDLAQYLYAEGKKKEAVATFRKARDVISRPLNFDGPGFVGRSKMTLEDIEAAEQQRQRDTKRFQGESQHIRYADIRNEIMR
jgi:hypothetical protein